VAFFQELELYRDDLLDKPAMLVVNKMDVAEAQFKYDEVKDKLRHLSGKLPTLLNLHAACDHL
jgi:GTPase involved in cell partitioning and DNA repair